MLLFIYYVGVLSPGGNFHRLIAHHHTVPSPDCDACTSKQFCIFSSADWLLISHRG